MVSFFSLNSRPFFFSKFAPIFPLHISRKSNRSKLATRGTGNTARDVQATGAHGRPNSAQHGPACSIVLPMFSCSCLCAACTFVLRAHANETYAQAAGDTPAQALFDITNAQSAVSGASYMLNQSYASSLRGDNTILPRHVREKRVAVHRTFPSTEAGSSGASASSALSVASTMQVRLLV